MSKIINITDKFSTEKPSIQIGEKVYEINDGLSTVLKFQELLDQNDTQKTLDALELVLGRQAAKELNIKDMPSANFRVIVIAIMAAIQGIDYDEAAARFQKETSK